MGYRAAAIAMPRTFIYSDGLPEISLCEVSIWFLYRVQRLPRIDDITCCIARALNSILPNLEVSRVTIPPPRFNYKWSQYSPHSHALLSPPSPHFLANQSMQKLLVYSKYCTIKVAEKSISTSSSLLVYILKNVTLYYTRIVQESI